MKKDYIPLWISLGSGLFGLLTTIADNLTKNLVIQIPAEKTAYKLQSVSKPSFDLMNWILMNPKIIIFASISVVGVVVFCVIKFKNHKINRKRK